MIAESLQALAVPVESLKPLEGNPRRGDVKAVARSLERFGQRKPVVALRDGTVLAGNHLLAAALELGWPELAVTWADDDQATARAFALADNRTAELGTFDLGDLAAMAAEVYAADPALLEAASYSEADLNALLAGQEVPPKLTDPDEVPEPPAEPVTQPGDLWLLGPHRLLCGDATSAEDYGRLLLEGLPRVVLTDPPYGIGYEAMRREDRIVGDATPEEAEQVIHDALALAHKAEAHFVFCDWRSLSLVHRAMEGAALDPKACIVWDKQRGVQNLDRFYKRHEFIVYAGPYGGQRTVDSDVWECPRDFDPDHPTPKPVDLLIRALAATSEPGDLVLDLFGGSGSTLIAAHDAGRVARLMELDPSRVDVAARRYQEHTGTKPVLEMTGEPHDFTAG